MAGLPKVLMTSAGVTSIGTLADGPTLNNLGAAISYPTDQGPQPYTGTWTDRSGSITNAEIATAIVAAAGGVAAHSYVPANTITLTDGAPSTHGVLAVATTGVVSATVAAGGTSGTNGTQTVTGTTGTGTKFTASVTVAGNAITAVLSITLAGVYTVNPTTLATEPVTGAGLSGAQLNIIMGVVSVTITTAGIVTAVPANPVAQASSSGAGTGATFTLIYEGIAQTLMASNTSRKAFFIQNPATAKGQGIAIAENIYINYTSPAEVEDGVSIELLPGGSIPISQVISAELISVEATTIGHRYIAREM